MVIFMLSEYFSILAFRFNFRNAKTQNNTLKVIQLEKFEVTKLWTTIH